MSLARKRFLEPPDTPNEDLDNAVRDLLKKANGAEPAVACKIIATAIAWEKTKHLILDQDEEFDPEDL